MILTVLFGLEWILDPKLTTSEDTQALAPVGDITRYQSPCLVSIASLVPFATVISGELSVPGPVLRLALSTVIVAIIMSDSG